MNRPPRKKGFARKRSVLSARFSPEDRDLIEGAWHLVASGKADSLTPEQAHAADCVAHAVKAFHERLAKLHPWPVNEGEWFFRICKPATFFDEFVVALVMQDIATATRRGVALGKVPPAPGDPPEFGRCPDVTFPPA